MARTKRDDLASPAATRLVPGGALCTRDREALPVGQPTPDAVRLAAGEGSGQAFVGDFAQAADQLGYGRGFTGLGVEQFRIGFGASGAVPPFTPEPRTEQSSQAIRSRALRLVPLGRGSGSLLASSELAEHEPGVSDGGRLERDSSPTA